MIRFKVVLALGLGVLSSQALTQDAVPTGHFEGEVVAKWRKDGRTMELMEPFAYVDSGGIRWNAPKGSIVDGASIPKLAWTLVGGPFEGKYRDASVIHDVACVEKNSPWQSVHYVFYEAMLTSGVGRKRAKTMYAAVYHFGPRWERVVTANGVPDHQLDQTIGAMSAKYMGEEQHQAQITPLPVASCTNPPCAPPDRRFDVTIRFQPEANTMTETEFKQLQARIEAEDLSLEEIDAFNGRE